MLRALSLLLLATPALAQLRQAGDYPEDRPVRVVLALAPGGNADINARLVSSRRTARSASNSSMRTALRVAAWRWRRWGAPLGRRWSARSVRMR